MLVESESGTESQLGTLRTRIGDGNTGDSAWPGDTDCDASTSRHLVREREGERRERGRGGEGERGREGERERGREGKEGEKVLIGLKPVNACVLTH